MPPAIDAARSFRKLLDLTTSLLNTRDLERALRMVTDAALDLLPAEHTSIRILDESGTQLLSGARSGEGANTTKPMSFKRGEGLVGWVVVSGKSARVFDTERDPRFARKPGQGFSIRSMVVVPLWSGGQVIGVLGATSSAVGAFTKEHELVAQLLANCAVPPIERARLERLAITDRHTMAYNKEYLIPRLTEEIARARRYVLPLSVLLLDLDHFKRVNDTYGHQAGDAVLKEFADRVRAMIRRSDVLVRRGGEEFVVILPQTTLDQAATAAERICRAVAAEPFPLPDGGKLTQTVSIGVATWNGAEGAKELEKRADEAMYAAKRLGRNRVEIAT